MTHDVYSAAEQSFTFINPTCASGAGYVAFLPQNLPPGSGWQSDPYDFSSSAHATLFRWRAKASCQGLPLQYDTVDFYWASFDTANDISSSGTKNIWFPADGALSSGNQYVTDATDKRRNTQYLGSVTIENAAASGQIFGTSGLAQLYGRYGALMVFNNTAASLGSGVDAVAFNLTAWPDEIQ